MLWKNRILSAAMAFVIAAAAAAAVTRFAPEPLRFSPGEDRQSVTFEATGVPSDEIVAVLDGNSAPAELLTYQIGYSCSYLDYLLRAYTGAGLDLDEPLPDGGDAREYVMSESLEMLKQQLALENLAARHGVTLSAETEARLAADRAQYIEQLGEDGYLEEIRKLGLSEAGYDRVTRANELYSALYDAYSTPGTALYADDAVLAAYAADKGYITADHILLPTVELDSGEPLDASVVAERRALAERLLAQLRASDDPVALFGELAGRYSEDTGRAANPDGYTFAEGRMVDEFDAAARALGENEISGVVESQYGYHIILRKPLDAAEAADAVRGECFDTFFLDEVARAELQTSGALARFDVGAVYRALQTAQGADDAA